MASWNIRFPCRCQSQDHEDPRDAFAIRADQFIVIFRKKILFPIILNNFEMYGTLKKSNNSTVK